MKSAWGKTLTLHAGFFLAIFLLQFIASEYHVLTATRIMVLAILAVGYNLLFGYTGLLSLGHAMFFAVGLYSATLGITQLGLSVPQVFFGAIAIGALFSALIGAIALRARGIAFMIVTLMFSQAAYLTVLYFGDVTRGDEGIVIKDDLRKFEFLGLPVDLTDAVLRFNLALICLALVTALILFIVKTRTGRILVAIRENETRTAMLGYDTARFKLLAVTLSGTLAALSGALYALMFAYAGSTLASIQYSINPLLWCLVGGAATTLGPIIGTAVMFLLIDWASGFTTANLLAVGVVLILTVVFFPKGIWGTTRQKWLAWLP